jgi:predicted PurR-regulated permease PerM
MNTETGSTARDEHFVDNMIESALRIGLIFLLLIWTYAIIEPFIIPIIWGAIIAVALMPATMKLKKILGGRQALAGVLLTIVTLAALIVPAIIVTESLVETARSLAAAIDRGDLQIPSPPPEVAEWPFIGKPVSETWMLASTNIEAAFRKLEPQLTTAGSWLLGQVASSFVGIVMFVVSILIAGLFMVKADLAVAATKKMATRIVGDQGPEWADLSAATVRSVVQGVLGVAVIQAFLAALGLFLMDIPGAGFWSVLILLLAIMQLPPFLVLGPIIAYVFSYAETTPAVIFTVWSLIASFSDTVLKPLLMGRGLDVPMPIILLGAIGGMLLAGIIGLFGGAVVLAIAYKLMLHWIETPGTATTKAD